MQDSLLGSLAIAVGALLCWRGYLAMRVIIPIWGAFTGFVPWFTSASATERLDDEWWWYVIVVVLAVAGTFGQLAATGRRHATIRRAWAAGDVRARDGATSGR